MTCFYHGIISDLDTGYYIDNAATYNIFIILEKLKLFQLKSIYFRVGSGRYLSLAESEVSDTSR